MKKLIYLLVLICFLATTGQAMAYSIFLNPSSQTIGLGNNTVIKADLSVGPAENLFGFNFDFGFNPGILRFNSLLFNPALSDYVTGFDAPSPANPGLVTFNGDLDLFAVNGLTNDAFTLATLCFKGIGNGNSPLSLGGMVLDLDPAADLVPLNATGNIDVVSAVPEPGTILMLGLGLVGLVGLKRKGR